MLEALRRGRRARGSRAAARSGDARIHAPHQQRHRHVLQRGELGQQVVELVDEAEGAVAQPAALGFAHRFMARPAITTVPRVGRSRPPSSCSSVVLPEPEAPTIARRSPGADRGWTPAQHLQRPPPWTKSLARSCPRARIVRVLHEFDAILSHSAGLPPEQARRAPGRDRASPAHASTKATPQIRNTSLALHVRRQIAHVVDARVQELEAEEVLEAVHQRLQVDARSATPRRRRRRAEQPDQAPWMTKIEDAARRRRRGCAGSRCRAACPSRP